jgi:ribosomal protein S18 acetylase RimI-like enzyme
MTKAESKLDNPVWYSLSETHQRFAIEYDGVKFYQPLNCSFGAFIKLEKTPESLDQYSRLRGDFYVVGNKPDFSHKLMIKRELVCLQMVLDKPIQLGIAEEITELKAAHQNELLALVNLVQPGYFTKQTSELGNYYGIFKDSKLVAVTGERLKMDSFTEVSAVVTHPGHTGKGYAKQLIVQTTDKIFLEQKIPYLHVAESNLAAINLYQKLGFKTRRKISFWSLTTNDNS